METMKVAVFTGLHKIELQDLPKPMPMPGRLLVKVEASAICTWEQRAYTGVNKIPYPFVGGHEVAGRIEALGEGVNKEEWHIGDTVVIGAPLACRNCTTCKSGHPESCAHFDYHAPLDWLPGYRGMGGLSEYMAVRPESLFHYDGVPAVEAALTEPVTCVVHSIEKADVALGDTVVVIGAGIMGQLHMLLAGLRGARVILSDPDERRLALAKDLGADFTVNPQKEDLAARVREIMGGSMADIVFDVTASPALVQEAMRCVRPRGKVLFYSSIHPTEPVLFDPNWVHSKSIQLLGTVNSNDRDFIRATRLLSNGTLSTKPFVSAVYPKERIKDAFEAAVAGDKYRVVVTS